MCKYTIYLQFNIILYIINGYHKYNYIIIKCLLSHFYIFLKKYFIFYGVKNVRIFS